MLIVGHHRQSAHALIVETKVLGERLGDQDIEPLGNEKTNGGLHMYIFSSHTAQRGGKREKKKEEGKKKKKKKRREKGQ